MEIDFNVEEKIKDVLNNGPSATWVVAAKIGMRGDTPTVRKILQYMQQMGLVRRHIHSCANNIVWQLVNLTEYRLHEKEETTHARR